MDSPVQKIGYSPFEMDHTQLSHAPGIRTPLCTPRTFANQQRLRSIVPSGEDLYDPPTTAKAFARLQAAIDEANHHGFIGDIDNRRSQIFRAIVASGEDLYDPPITAEAFARLQTAIGEAEYSWLASDQDDGGHQLLDPPTTAERFAMIESALDEALAQPVTAPRCTRKPDKSKSAPRLHASTTRSDNDAHLLRKRQMRRAEPTTPTVFHHSKDIQSECATLSSSTRQPHRYGQSQQDYFWRRIGGIHINLPKPTELPAPEADAPLYSGSNLSRPNSDIFRDDASVQSFANQTYQSAREKYL